jgi:hypothetical protein
VLLSAGCLCALLPFIVAPQQVRPSDYLAYLELAMKHPRYAAIFLANIAMFLKFVAPVLFALIVGWQGHSRAWLESVVLLFLSGIGICAVASKVGAGPPHILPLALPTAYLASEGMSLSPVPRLSLRATAVLGVITLLSAAALCNRAFQNQKYVFTRLFLDDAYRARIESATKELDAISARYRGKTIAMGYSEARNADENYQLTYLKPLLYASGRTNFVDAPALMDMELAGLPFPKAAIAKLRSQEIGVFVVPKVGRPFMKASWYNGRDIFSDEFRAAFHANYTKQEDRQYFAVWVARRFAATAGGRAPAGSP